MDFLASNYFAWFLLIFFAWISGKEFSIQRPPASKREWAAASYSILQSAPLLYWPWRGSICGYSNFEDQS